MSYIAWLRSLIGRQKTILVFASVILRDDQGNIVLQRRTDFDVWGLPGGILEPGESILDCARREAQEETGLSVDGLECVGVYSDPAYDTTYPNGDQVQQYTVCFQGRICGGEFFVDGIETSELRFFAPSDLPLQEMALFYVQMLQDALGGAPQKSGPAFSPAYRLPGLQDVFPLVRPLIGNAHYIGAGAMAAVVNDHNQLLMVQRLDDREWSIPVRTAARPSAWIYHAGRERRPHRHPGNRRRDRDANRDRAPARRFIPGADLDLSQRRPNAGCDHDFPRPSGRKRFAPGSGGDGAGGLDGSGPGVGPQFAPHPATDS